MTAQDHKCHYCRIVGTEQICDCRITWINGVQTLWTHDTSDLRHFGPRTLLHQCQNVRKTLQHWCRNVRTLRHQFMKNNLEFKNRATGNYGLRNSPHKVRIFLKIPVIEITTYKNSCLLALSSKQEWRIASQRHNLFLSYMWLIRRHGPVRYYFICNNYCRKCCRLIVTEFLLYYWPPFSSWSVTL